MQNLPYDIAAEKRLLSSIVSMPDESLLRLSECEVQGITERSFFDANNQILWSAIHAVGSNGKNIELYSIYEKLKELGKLETIGGVQAISGMASLSCSIFLEENVKSVRQLELRRNLMRVTDTATMMASELKYDVDGVVSYIDAEVQKIGETSVGDTTQTMEQVAKANEEELGCLINGVSVKDGLITGFPTLDRFTNGLQPKTMVVVAARPSVGKTSLVMNIAERIITKETNKSILFFSLEMDSLAIIKKLICSMSGVSMGRMADGFITTNQREEVKKAKETIEKSNFWINENSDLTISKMRAIARQKNRRKKLDLIIIDYIQFIQPNDLKANKETQTSEISRNIKAMAKEIGCPVIALSQLSRDSDKGERRPKLSDLRDSGAIEQDADVVTFLWPNRDTGLVELLIAKNRTGMTGVCELQFKPEITKFVEVKK